MSDKPTPKAEKRVKTSDATILLQNEIDAKIRRRDKLDEQILSLTEQLADALRSKLANLTKKG